jgi:hypothetical protein
VGYRGRVIKRWTYSRSLSRHRPKVPLRIGFDFDAPPSSYWFWVDVVIDV